LSRSFNFLVHKLFKTQLENFEESHPQAYKSLLKQLQKAQADPYRAGEMMRSLPQHLQGKLFRLRVRGRRGFRYIYMVNREQSCVFGIFVSPEQRSKFDYNKFPWMEIAEEIHQDLTSGNREKFQVWSFQPRKDK